MVVSSATEVDSGAGLRHAPGRWRSRLLVTLLLASCGECTHTKGAPPDENTWRLVKDPYPTLEPRGKLTDSERAAKAIDQVAAELGYAGAGDEIRQRTGEPWMIRETLLLAHGGDEQIDAAWIDAQGSLVEATSVPAEMRVLLRQSEARVLDARRAKVAPSVMRRTQLAELAWMLHLLARLRADAGMPPVPGFDGK